ncbi:hypothetical protein pdam_00024738 [Pocillopora damicornis]|uniref:Uncharacterized protein n=1 Tax=Pocillopora damicornis TaxID=46731 RepID=A0A3M6TF13_POCDA|nr:hypothetical protein pdam_00024738 [Pocillopora damicornis]
MWNGTAYMKKCVALREMAQRNVEWYSVHTNGVYYMKYFDVVANGRARLWRGEKAIPPKP